MGASYEIKIYAPGTGLDSAALSAEINRQLAEINRQMSNWQTESVLSRFNRSASGEWFELPAEFCSVMTEALRIGRLSGGAFDVTAGAVVNLWGFGPEQRTKLPPAPAEIKEALDAGVGSQYLELRTQPCALRKRKPGVYVDLSAIAKGFAVDAIAAYLDQGGYAHYLVEIGGEIKARGNKPGGTHWRIGIEKPLDHERATQAAVTLNNLAMATSGDYRNYFTVDGQRYSHTIDPATGWPITHALASVTVLHESTMTADALATALLILGPERGWDWALRHGIAAFFVLRDGEKFSSAMTPKFEALMM